MPAEQRQPTVIEGVSLTKQSTADANATWVPYEGPRGGEGWQRIDKPKVVRYQDAAPGDVAEGYRADFWDRFGSDGDAGYIGPAWDDALAGTPYRSPDEIPEGTEITVEFGHGGTVTGEVTEFQYGDQFPERDNDPGKLVVTNQNGREFTVWPNETIHIASPDDGDDARGDGRQPDWITDISHPADIDPGDDVLFVNQNGVREVGTAAGPAAVETVDGMAPGVELADGREVSEQALVAYAEQVAIPDDLFDAAVDVTDARNAGIRGGNTTGDDMVICRLDDEARVFATPAEAYEHTTTGVVSGRDEAVSNNLNSPTMIEHLGGNACKTKLVEDNSGREYIAKEGIDGKTLKDLDYTFWDGNDEAKESLAQTLAAAFFVGNGDLHGGNLMVNTDTNEGYVIDHDSAGPSSFGGWYDLSRMTRFHNAINRSEVRSAAFDITEDYVQGDLDLPEDVTDEFHDYFEQAVTEVQEYDVFWNRLGYTDGSVTETPDGYQALDDLEAGMELVWRDPDTGKVHEGELTDHYQGTWYGETDDNYEIGVTDMRNVVTITDESGVTETLNDVQETLPAGYDTFGDLDEGDRLAVTERDGDQKTVEVSYINGQMHFWDPEVDRHRELRQYVRHIADIEDVDAGDTQ